MCIRDRDIRVVQQVIDSGRALVIAYNKWDLTDEERRHFLAVSYTHLDVYKRQSVAC